MFIKPCTVLKRAAKMGSPYSEPAKRNSHSHSLLFVSLNIIRQSGVKLTVKFTQEQTTKAQRENRGIALLFL